MLVGFGLLAADKSAAQTPPAPKPSEQKSDATTPPAADQEEKHSKSLEKPCPGGKLLARHAYSECGPDGFWYVVEDDYYDCPPVKRFRVWDYKTMQPCTGEKKVPAPDPIGTGYEDFNGSGCTEYESLGTMDIYQCKDGFWYLNTYEVFECKDGRRLVRFKDRKATGKPCAEPPPDLNLPSAAETPPQAEPEPPPAPKEQTNAPGSGNTSPDTGTNASGSGSLPPPAALPGGHASTIDQGTYQTICFDTDQGRINVNLPKDQSDTLTGTVEVIPKSDASSDTLNGMVVGVQTNGQTAQTGKVAAGMLTAAGVGGGVLALVLLDSDGHEVARKTVERQPVKTPPTDYNLPHLGRPGKTIEVTGPTTGRHEAEELLVGDKPAAFITESTAGSVWRVPADVPPGPTTLKLEEAGQEHSDQFNVVRLRLSAPTTTLTQGAHTEVTTTVEGLEGMDLKRHPVSVRLTIGDPSVVRFTSKGAGGVLTQPVKPDQVKNGVYAIRSRVQAVRDGGFQIVGDIAEETQSTQ